KYWRASTREGAADDHVHLQDVRGPVSGRPEGEETELRNVDDDGRGRECRQPAPALEREIDLTHVDGRGRLARGEQPIMRERLLEQTVVEELRLEGGKERADVARRCQTHELTRQVQVICPRCTEIKTRCARVDTPVVQIADEFQGRGRQVDIEGCPRLRAHHLVARRTTGLHRRGRRNRHIVSQYPRGERRETVRVVVLRLKSIGVRLLQSL